METLHLAYAAVDDNGITRDVSLLIDKDEVKSGHTFSSAALGGIEKFLQSCGLIGPHEGLDTRYLK
jgi:hypothetical protein